MKQVPTPVALLEVRGLSKSFGALQALEDVDFTLRAGEIHALLGENGAGKSTLIKVADRRLSRAMPAIVRLDGAESRRDRRRAALDAGIGTVYQEVNLLPNLSVAREPLSRPPADAASAWSATPRCAGAPRALLAELRPRHRCRARRSAAIRSRCSRSSPSPARSISRRGS